MPWGDGTGPWGLGPMTGRGFGYCAGYPHPGFVIPFPRGGRWFFWRRSRRFWGRGWWRFCRAMLFFRPMYHRMLYYAPWYW